MSQLKTLDQLAIGASAEILCLHMQGQAAVRLMEMGLFEGTRVTVIRRAPLGDPIELEVGDFRLSLRAIDASKIELKP